MNTEKQPKHWKNLDDKTLKIICLMVKRSVSLFKNSECLTSCPGISLKYKWR